MSQESVMGGRTDGRTDGQTDGRTDKPGTITISPTFVESAGINMNHS